MTDEGLFEGKISTDDGDQYVIAQSKHHFTDPQQFHSVIYRHSDVHIPSLEDTKCKSDEIHSRIRTLQEEEGQKNRKFPHINSHHHTRLKSKEKGSSEKHKHNIDKGLTGSIFEKPSTDSVSFDTSQSHNKLSQEKPEIHSNNKSAEQTHISGAIDSNMKIDLPELGNVNVIDNTMGKPLSNVYESDRVDDHKRKYPAKNHKSAQNHHRHHHNHHHHHQHHHQDRVATTTSESKSEFQRLIDEYGDLKKSAIDIINLDLEEIDIDTNEIGHHSDKDNSRPENVDAESKPISLPRDTPSISATDKNTSRKPLMSDVEHKDKDDGTGSQGNRPHHRQKRTMIDPTRITCSLYLQADHLFYQKFHSNEETVIEQLTQHVQGVNEIYGAIGKYHL